MFISNNFFGFELAAFMEIVFLCVVPEMYQFVVLIIVLMSVNISPRKECKEKYLITSLISEWQSAYLSCLLIIYVTAKDQTSANVDISQKGPGKHQE